MDDKKLGQEPAFPTQGWEQTLNGVIAPVSQDLGISKRFYAACKAMQGILSNQLLVDKYLRSNQIPEQAIINASYVFADELLKQENQRTN